jgi:hypothetical protein
MNPTSAAIKNQQGVQAFAINDFSQLLSVHFPNILHSQFTFGAILMFSLHRQRPSTH